MTTRTILTTSVLTTTSQHATRPVHVTRFFRVTDSDRRAFSINYYRVFHEEMLKLFRDLMIRHVNWTFIDGQPEFLDNSALGTSL